MLNIKKINAWTNPIKTARRIINGLKKSGIITIAFKIPGKAENVIIKRVKTPNNVSFAKILQNKRSVSENGLTN